VIITALFRGVDHAKAEKVVDEFNYLHAREWDGG
jgi:hypothetical protein